jgi:hypothetical protein
MHRRAPCCTVVASSPAHIISPPSPVKAMVGTCGACSARDHGGQREHHGAPGTALISNGLATAMAENMYYFTSGLATSLRSAAFLRSAARFPPAFTDPGSG